MFALTDTERVLVEIWNIMCMFLLFTDYKRHVCLKMSDFMSFRISIQQKILSNLNDMNCLPLDIVFF